MSQVFPILLIFLSGYIFKRLHKDTSEALVDLVLYFIFPAFIIYKIHFLQFDEAIYVVTGFGIVAFALGIAFTLLVAKIFSINKNSTAMIAMSVAFGNTSFLGFAFVEGFYGEYALSLAIFYDQIAVMVMLSLFAPIICTIGGGTQKISFGKVFKSLITFPPTIAFVLAIVSKLFMIPEVLVGFLEKISLVLVPLVVFAVGMKFTLSSVKGKSKEIFLILAIKMFFIPLSLFLIGTSFFDMNLAIKVAILESAMPPMVLATVIAIRSGLDKELGLGSLGLGMILSFVTIPLLVEFLG